MLKLDQKIKLDSQQETLTFAREFAARLRPGDTVAFYGDLGSGKTFICKEICRALGSESEATSPTFTIINEYHTTDDLYIYHFDFYRLENVAELANLGLEEYFFNENICLIEWPEKIGKALPEQRYEVHIDFVEGDPESRDILVKSEK